MAMKENNELVNGNQAFLIYQDDKGIARVNVRFEGEDVWLTQERRNLCPPAGVGAAGECCKKEVV